MANELAQINEVELRGDIEPVIETANAIAILSPQDRAFAVEFGKAIKATENRVITRCKKAVEDAYQAHKSACALRDSFLDPLMVAERLLKGKILTYDAAEEKTRKAEEARLQALADEKARKERESLEKRAEAIKSPERKEALLEQAAAVQAPVITLAPACEKQKGEATRKTWTAHLIDKAALIRAAADGNALAGSFLAFDDSAANAAARATKGAVPVPGIEWLEERNLSLGRL